LTLRQRSLKTKGAPNIALADFIAQRQVTDYISFCVTTGFGVDEWAAEFEKDLDDYNSIMVKGLLIVLQKLSLNTRKKVRKEIGDMPQMNNEREAMITAEEYREFRPAPGYPACPDHLEKKPIWKLLNVEKEIGVTLTESMAMWPASSVSGYYFGNPQSKYFGLGKNKKDQVLITRNVEVFRQIWQ
jgi:5-methyltetrahydrofolate--homocysteine methyltransferase